MLYQVVIKEIVSKVEYIEAESAEAACDEATRMYDNGEVDMDKDVILESNVSCVGAVKEGVEA